MVKLTSVCRERTAVRAAAGTQARTSRLDGPERAGGRATGAHTSTWKASFLTGRAISIPCQNAKKKSAVQPSPTPRETKQRQLWSRRLRGNWTTATKPRQPALPAGVSRTQTQDARSTASPAVAGDSQRGSAEPLLFFLCLFFFFVFSLFFFLFPKGRATPESPGLLPSCSTRPPSSDLLLADGTRAHLAGGNKRAVVCGYGCPRADGDHKSVNRGGGARAQDDRGGNCRFEVSRCCRHAGSIEMVGVGRCRLGSGDVTENGRVWVSGWDCRREAQCQWGGWAGGLGRSLRTEPAHCARVCCWWVQSTVPVVVWWSVCGMTLGLAHPSEYSTYHLSWRRWLCRSTG